MRPNDPVENHGPSGLLARTMAVVEAVAAAGEPVGPRGLARVTGIDRSAVGRILQQLTDLEVLERTGDRYIPGPRLFALARIALALDDLPTAARSVLASLVERFNETCYVCVRHGDAAVFLYEAQSTRPLRYVVELGKPVPLHAGGAGRAILAGIGIDRAKELLTALEPLPALTPQTITDLDRLLELAAQDAARGYSASFGERVEGGVAIGAPFYNGLGECTGSVVFTGPVSRVSGDRVDQIGRAVAQAAAVLTARLGGG